MGLLDKILSGGIGDVIEKVGNAVDKVVTTKAESETLKIELTKVINEHEEKIITAAQAELDSYLADTQSARENFTKIQESDKSSWLAKNILPLLTVGVTLGFFGLLGYMLKEDVPAANKDILNIMLGSLGTAWISIIGYFFGSSVGAKVNGDTIRKMITK